MKVDVQDIVCFEAGSQQTTWIGLIAELKEDLPALQRLASDGVIVLELTSTMAHISGVDRVGLVVLPSGRRLVIRSKIGSLCLLNWLAYLGEFPPLNAWLPNSGIAIGDDLHTCIAKLFLYELDKLTRLHLRKDYASICADEPTIRGHILTTQLVRRLHRLPHVPQRIRSRTFDTSCNIVLARALDRLPMLLATESATDRKLLAQLRELWLHVQRQMADPVTAVTEAQWASPPGYRTALQLARLIMNGVALDLDSSVGSQAFTISLALIWERSLRRMMFDIQESTGWVSTPDSERIRQWDDSCGRNDPTRWLTADVLVARDESRWVLDAKYKRAFGNESRLDRFQMCAYAVGFRAERVSLVYPSAQIQPQRRILLDVFIGMMRVVIDSINLPMPDGPEACKNSLIRLCQA